MADSSTPQRIGLVDYRLDNFHANTFLNLLRGPLASRGYQVVGATALAADEGNAWCERHGVPWLDSVADLNDQVDCFLILAPSNPELHYQLCQAVFPHGKITFVDKTFAPDGTTAEAIFALADRYDIPVQTTSALRYTSVQPLVASQGSSVRHLYIWAGGGTFAEYGIHPVELAVSCFGGDARDILSLGSPQPRQLLLRWPAERTAVIDFAAGVDVPYIAAVTTDQETHVIPIDLTNLFRDALSAILDFFDAGVSQIDRRETLLVRKVLDLALEPSAAARFLPL